MKNVFLPLIFSAATSSAGITFAQDVGEYSGYTGFVSTKTRAEVKAELLQAQQRGEIAHGEQYPKLEADAGPGKTRTQVYEELVAYRKTRPVVSDDVATY